MRLKYYLCLRAYEQYFIDVFFRLSHRHCYTAYYTHMYLRVCFLLRDCVSPRSRLHHAICCLSAPPPLQLQDPALTLARMPLVVLKVLRYSLVTEKHRVQSLKRAGHSYMGQQNVRWVSYPGLWVQFWTKVVSMTTSKENIKGNIQEET